MDVNDLRYKPLSAELGRVQTDTGLPESASFLYWFLINVYRLEETDARDAICDKPNDKGIDGIYVDHNEQEVHFLQAKIRQKNNGTVGDVGPKNLMSSMHQFGTPEKVATILAGNASPELKRLVQRIQLSDLLSSDYSIRAIYVSNELSDTDSNAYEALTPELRIFDRKEIAASVVDPAASTGKDEFTFNTSYVEPMEVEAGTPTSRSTMYVFPASALQLVHMEGISDGSLFEDNVRFTLGNTSVNKSIKASVVDKSTHANFLLFHNGITVLCKEVDASTEGQLKVKTYTVVNGAQSLTNFYNNKAKLTDDLRVLVKVIALGDDALARTITENSNNQNAIKPRDMRSNHVLMTRLQTEMSSSRPDYFFEIKRGEKTPTGKTTITNELAGRILLSFDLNEPWSAHQIYKVFDEKYAAIFGRPEVNAARIVFLYRLNLVVQDSMARVKNRPMASYTLTRFFILSVLAEILRGGSASGQVIKNPSIFDERTIESLLLTSAEILKTLIVDLNVAAAGEFDYKSVLKSPSQSNAIAATLRKDYEKDVLREKAEPIETWVIPDSKKAS
ncbi:AIPR family protein [Mycetocola zhadangensis]|uniref:Abortive phage infection protein C-terminal domain-containing protein n=1 Tax=Mycetocola zhadangensis TaxID=1164595 RepID=A0A3L7J694_9MICO|nr:AIPR family protein [Mycetocola zhadangensis]RLQ86177.1 hypothetical protein D9V28_04905 [Mycetocola zhadangensis]GGE89028.1 hypothetical protein GCM10011313_09650 [Mycetocola zhadangensis]